MRSPSIRFEHLSAMRYMSSVRRARFIASFPLHGLEGQRNEIPLVDRMSDDQLAQLNRSLDWNAFVLDGRGRRFGQPAGPGKRFEAEEIPDRRISMLDLRVPLKNKQVLEVGCFEGIHTVGLLRCGAAVTAIDARLENVIKTIVRTAMFGYSPGCFLRDLDSDGLPAVSVDIILHIGVLYHLLDPVKHLLELRRLDAEALLLDTHVAKAHEATSRYESEEHQIAYKDHDEGRIPNVFAGMSRRSRWLLLDDIQTLLGEAGFSRIDVLERREERNGPRVCLLAQR